MTVSIDQETKNIIKKCMKQLPGELQSRHGGTGFGGYSHGQVESALRRAGLPNEYSPYALAIFCFESDFRRAMSEKPEVLRIVLKKLKDAADSGFADSTGWGAGTWIANCVADALSGEGVGEIGSEGGDF